ncbi:HAD-IIIC family phosphatase [Paenibacillus sp. EKM208P]|nr:HAD-IIIC family phosphatase [Paenibacillus sp. EKM208P]
MKYLDQSYNQVLSYNHQIPNQADVTKITVVSNITLESVFADSFRYALYEELSIAADIQCIDFGFISGVPFPDHMLASKLILINFDIRELLASTSSVAEMEDVVYQHLQASLTLIRKVTAAPILWLLPEVTTNRYEHEIIKNMQSMIVSHMAELPECYTVDLTNAVLATGTSGFYDERSRLAFQLPYSFSGCMAICQEIVVQLRQMLGAYKKCIVLDCDYCLWGGILDEVGMNGITLDTTYPGNSYYAFQKELLHLHQCGVILTICSKNNEEDVFEVLREHPFMLIQENHISSYRINWSNKADNIKAIAKELNISTDSMVFIDDSEFEIELVNRTLPEVRKILLDKKKPYLYASYIRNLTCFKRTNLTEEDMTRNLSYEAEKFRRAEQAQYVDYKEYLNSLDIKLESETLNSFNAARISQLTQRTNRGNLSCVKYTDQELLALVNENKYGILSFKLCDKFGDYGYIGAVILSISKNWVTIKGFYLSCRAFNRGIEAMMMDEIFKVYQIQADQVVYKYNNNGKNTELKHFIEQYIAGRGKDSVEE